MSFIVIYLSGEAGLTWTSGSLKICIFHLKWKNWPSDYNLASEIISTLGEDAPICWLKPSGWPNSCNSHYKLMREHPAFYISGSRSLNNADHALGTLLDPQGPRLGHKHTGWMPCCWGHFWAHVQPFPRRHPVSWQELRKLALQTSISWSHRPVVWIKTSECFWHCDVLNCY